MNTNGTATDDKSRSETPGMSVAQLHERIDELEKSLKQALLQSNESRQTLKRYLIYVAIAGIFGGLVIGPAFSVYLDGHEVAKKALLGNPTAIQSPPPF